MEFYNTTLSNGLTLVGEKRDGAVSTALGFFVRTGSRDETPEIAGVSHFLEHMMFKGTARRSALDLTFEMGSIGAQANAFTSEENTVYYMAVLPEYFEQAMDIICDMLRPALDQKEFSTEKKVILEEIALYQDRPMHVLYEAGLKEFFGTHPAGNSVLGTFGTVGDLSREQMLEYFSRRYSPGNMVLAVSGTFEWERFVEHAESYCGKWQHYDVGREVPVHQPVVSKKIITKDNLQIAHSCLFASGPGANNEFRYTAQILAMIMGDYSGSRAYWELIDKGLADSASIDADDMDNTGFVMGYVSSTPEQIDKVSDILRGIMTTPTNFSDYDLERAKTKLRTRMVLQGESSMRRLMNVGLDWVYTGKYVSLENEIEEIGRISRQDITRMLEQFCFAPMTEIRLLPTE